MKKIKTLLLIITILLISGCGPKYKGYWCRYQETSTIVVLLNKDHTENQKNKISQVINKFEDIDSLNFYTREDYANEIGGNVNDMDIYDTYVVTFSSNNSIGTYIDELTKLKGVKEAKQSNAKTDISLYHIYSGRKYTYTNSDEANEEDLITGTYKEKDGVLTFIPDNTKLKTKMLYIKDGLICDDAQCKNIYFKSDDKCMPLEK